MPVIQQFPAVVERVQVAPHAMAAGLGRPISASVSVSIGELFGGLYLIGAGVFCLIFLIKMGRLLAVLRRCRLEKKTGCTLAEPTGQPLPAASFFGYVFWKNDGGDPLIFQHELAHVRGWHSLDVLLTEILVIFQWFNPMAWSLRRSLRTVHEYIADEWVVRNTQRRYDYALLLVKTAGPGFKEPAQGLTIGFESQIKNRLVMLAKSPSRPLLRAKYLLALPIAAALLMLFSFRLVEKITLPQPFSAALQKTSGFVENMAQSPVYQSFIDENKFSENPHLMGEPTPYIFYWGQFQVQIQKIVGTGEYLGEAELAGVDFSTSFDREPRLWNGNSLEKSLSFQLSSDVGDIFSIKSNYENPAEYLRARKFLNEKYPQIEHGSHFTITQLGLPNGRTATIQLFCSVEKPVDFKVQHDATYQELPAFARKSIFGSTADFVWGKHIDSRGLRRFFYTADEFFETAAEAPKYVVDEVEDVNTKGKISILPPGEDPVEWAFQTGKQEGQQYQSYQQCLQDLKEHKNMVRPGTMVFLDFENMPNDGKSRIIGTGTLMKIVADGSPMLYLTPEDRKLMSFRWGSFFRGFEAYGRSFTSFEGKKFYSDDQIKFEHHESSATELAQMLELSPTLWRKSELVGTPVFRVKFKDLEAEFVPGVGLPKDFVEAVKNGLRPGGDLLTVTGIRAGDWDISPLTIEFYPQADAEKQPLPPKTGSKKSADSGLTILGISPNPASGKTVTVSFEIPKPAAVTFTVKVADGPGSPEKPPGKSTPLALRSLTWRPESLLMTVTVTEPGVRTVSRQVSRSNPN